MAVDFFLKLKGLEGESKDEHHKNQIALMSWNWGANNVSSVAGTSGSGAGKVSLSDVTVSFMMGKSMPKMFKDICKGTHIEDGTLEAVKAGGDGKPYLKLDFHEIFITSLSTGASGGMDEVPMVAMSFTYGKMKIEYFEQGDKGTLTSTGAEEYSLIENKVSK